MTTALSARRRRTAAALGAVALPVVALAACTKPTPLAQLTVGDRTASTEAQCYEHGETIPGRKLNACANKESGASISVGEGDRVRFGVDPDVADTGWVLTVNGQRVSEPSNNTYVTYNGDQFFQSQTQTGERRQTDRAKVGIVEIDDKGNYKGTWSFDLKRKA